MNLKEEKQTQHQPVEKAAKADKDVIEVPLDEMDPYTDFTKLTSEAAKRSNIIAKEKLLSVPGWFTEEQAAKLSKGLDAQRVAEIKSRVLIKDAVALEASLKEIMTSIEDFAVDDEVPDGLRAQHLITLRLFIQDKIIELNK